MYAVNPLPAQRSRPGRPNKAESARIDARILEAAWQLFTDKGFAETSMEAIAERAGVTRATLYQRHEDKMRLLRASLAIRGEAWSEVSEGMDWLTGDSLEERLKNYARAILTWSNNSEVSAHRRLSERAGGAAAPLTRDLETAFRRRMARLLARDIADHARREGLTLSAPQELAVLIINLLDAIGRAGQREGHDLDQMIGDGLRAMDILLDGRAAW